MDPALRRISGEIEIALHHIKLAIDFRPATGGLNNHEPKHPMREVIRDHRSCAVIDEHAWLHCREAEGARRRRALCVTLPPPPGPITPWESMLWLTGLSMEFLSVSSTLSPWRARMLGPGA